MQGADEDRDICLEPGVPCVRALLHLTEALDQLQQRMLTFHFDSPTQDRVPNITLVSAAGGSKGTRNL